MYLSLLSLSLSLRGPPKALPSPSRILRPQSFLGFNASGPPEASTPKKLCLLKAPGRTWEANRRHVRPWEAISPGAAPQPCIVKVNPQWFSGILSRAMRLQAPNPSPDPQPSEGCAEVDGVSLSPFSWYQSIVVTYTGR